MTPTLERRSPEAFPASLDIKKQWEAQVRSLAESGILETDPSSHLFGIWGIDGKHYPVPTWQDIEARLKAFKVRP